MCFHEVISPSPEAISEGPTLGGYNVHVPLVHVAVGFTLIKLLFRLYGTPIRLFCALFALNDYHKI